ncbi:MAG: CDP-2,3-bis-(O-geranylgeranyl)-sn-glycerol synthase [Candidatus Marsarchaeota archaeon]|nr:CDP-2,3-bis-(O-geranylgeranyl)-sn-glycerol synthase [Candidatus Marsarchaeota archaeon]MCL5102093.1 CDP-2,3-bis-(O-geranylgeranyl)-sn-glycerol synthase [Candidatus Marsarchaeota archaeon]
MYQLLEAFWSIIVYPIIYIFPAYAANGAPVLFGGGKPLDMGRKFRGRRVFGDHKTIRGTASSLIAGLAVGIIEYPFFHYMIIVAVLLTVGANFGDLIGSFVKRQIGIKSGKSFPVMDQYGFFVFALIFALGIYRTGMPSVYGLIFITLLTGITHLLTNVGAYRLKLKDVPW